MEINESRPPKKKFRQLLGTAFIVGLAISLTWGLAARAQRQSALDVNSEADDQVEVSDAAADIPMPGAASSGAGSSSETSALPPVVESQAASIATSTLPAVPGPLQRTQLAAAMKLKMKRLAYLERCEASGACSDFDNSEAYSYDLSVRQTTASEIDDYTKLVRAMQIEQGGDLPKEAQRIARYFLKTGNDDVKEAALKLIELAPLSEANVGAAFEALETSASGPLMEVLMNSRIPDACAMRANVPMCRSFITHTMEVGGENLRRTFARYSLRITTRETLGALIQAEKKEDIRSQNRFFLRLNREEFMRMRHGG